MQMPYLCWICAWLTVTKGVCRCLGSGAAAPEIMDELFSAIANVKTILSITKIVQSGQRHGRAVPGDRRICP